MKLLTAIVNYKTPAMTLNAVEAAKRELLCLQGDWKITIVDNDSQDGSLEKLQYGVKSHQAQGTPGWDRVEVVDTGQNGGYGAGNNFAIRRALESTDPPEYFYVLNSDAFPESQAINRLLDYLEQHPQVGIVGSYIHGSDGEPHVTAFRFPSICGEFEGGIRLNLITKLLKNYVVPMGIPQQTQEVDWLAGASFMIRRQVLEEIGLFDENFFLYFEETDLCYRARRAGWITVYVKESSVSHIGSVSTGMKNWQNIPQYWFDSREYYFLKNHGRIYLWTATIACVIGCSLHAFHQRIRGKKITSQPGFLRSLLCHSVRRTKARTENILS